MVSFCSISSTDSPRAFSASRYSATCSTIFGARPSVGSSMMISSGSPISVRHSVEHLLLAAGQHAGLGVLAFAQAREHRVHVVEGPARRSCAPRLLAQLQVLVHGQLAGRCRGSRARSRCRAARSRTASGRPATAPFHAMPPCVSTRPITAFAVVERPEPLRPSSATISPGATSQRHAVQHVALAVERVELVELQHHASSPCACASTEPR